MRDFPIRGVLFDAGNTLLHLDYELIAQVLGEHGYATNPLAIRIAEYSAKAALDRALAPGGTSSESPEKLLWSDEDGRRLSYFEMALLHLGVPGATMAPIVDVLQAHNRASCLWRVVAPDTPRVLDALRARGFVLAVVSNADGRIEADLQRNGLGARFADVVDSHVVGIEKPDPAIFRLALGRLGLTPDAAVYVGDVFSIDILGARAAGMHGVLIDTLGRYPGNVDCQRITGLAELLDLLPQQAPTE